MFSSKTVVDLFDRGEGRRVGLVQRGEQREQPYGAEGGVREFDRHGEPIFDQLDRNRFGATSDRSQDDVA